MVREFLPAHDLLRAAEAPVSRSGALALLLHQGAEGRLVDRDTGLSGHLEGQVDRESVGVVQGEGVLAGHGVALELVVERDRVQVHHTEVGVVAVLQTDPLRDRAEGIAQMQGVGRRLRAGEDDGLGWSAHDEVQFFTRRRGFVRRPTGGAR